VHSEQTEGRGHHAQKISESIIESSNCKADKQKIVDAEQR
jgi:hypothetical protein